MPAVAARKIPIFGRMAGNSLGTLFKLTTFGESHGEAIGGIIDGCPAGLQLDLDAIQKELDRRKPGQSDLTTQRKESDTVRWLSGIFEGKTTGTPIAFIIPNADQRSKDYGNLKDVYRPSHADYVYEAKYGIRDHRGGGRSSARETACRVAAGAIAKQFLLAEGIEVKSYVSAIGQVEVDMPHSDLDLTAVENEVRCPDPSSAKAMRTAIENARDEGDTLGGIVTGLALQVPAGLGEPVFDKLHADLGKAMLSINAVKGFDIGSGFAAAKMRGSDHNDGFEIVDGKPSTKTNHSGGIQGGISNGMDIVFRVAFKPVASIGKKQNTITREGKETELEIKGRHDPCVVPRAVPIVEAMTALILADHILRNRTIRV
ncbi:MAG TPA: chorismate synthase [Cryomorphaceae bacterium]|nr:chorismate synthase [Cryomorphaceae bacterium]